MIGIVITISKGLFFLMKKSLMYKALKGVTGLFTILALVLVGFILTGKISHTQIVRAVSDAPYTIKNTVNKIRNGVPHTTEYISASPIFELGHETILELKTDSQPLQVEALEITFEEPQIVESTEVVDSSSITSVDASQKSIQTEISTPVEDYNQAYDTAESTVQAVTDVVPVVTEVSTPVVEQTQSVSISTPTVNPVPSGSVLDDVSAKEWIAQKESGGSYTVSNGVYIGRYQLHSAYLNGDHSPENQERVADAYVLQRYGSWSAAYQFWLANGWY